MDLFSLERSMRRSWLKKPFMNVILTHLTTAREEKNGIVFVFGLKWLTASSDQKTDYFEE
jgi:hypothetical protein